MKIFGDSRSGNCLKVRYVATLLSLPFDWQEVDVLSGYTRTPEFLTINPAGQIPTVRFGDGRILAQSNAIMRYLAQGSHLLPQDAWQQAKMDEWLFWEQYSHEPAIAVVRFLRVLKQTPEGEIDPRLIAKGEAALDLMEHHLDGKDYFVGDALSLADIALYAYTQFAEEGGFSLESHPNITAWLERMAAQLSAVGAA
jgi:glutathione S-transferase